MDYVDIRHRVPTNTVGRLDKLAAEVGLPRSGAMNLVMALGLDLLDRAGLDAVAALKGQKP